MTESHPNDRRFFTNEPGATLFDRFGTILDHARYFDMLVGYFRTSGYKALHQKLSTVEKHRILVGLNVDQRSYDLFSQAQQGQLNFESHSKAKEEYTSSLVNELEHGEDAPEVEESARQFIEALQSGRLELRAFPSQDLHAKVYISRFPEGYPDFGRVITGSSNFSLNGLLAQREFNVELKDRSDVDFALQKFEELWQEGVDVSAAYVDTVRNKTWLSDTITPYDIYLKFLFEYFQEDINLDNEVDIELPEGFMDLAYQKQAVVTARKILEAYNGVFIADVVGLGKTYISAMLLQGYPGRKLVICPPPLENYWKETFLEFGVRGTEVRSLGKLDDILEKGVEKYQYVLIDEAHRFRTDTTQTYEKLHRICWGKRVILVSATPLNNRLEDILSLLKLFQPARKGTIPGVPNLEDFFKKLAQDLKAWDKSDPGYLTAVKEASEQVREKVLSHVMVRRTRTEIQKYFSEDLKAQGLSFPTLAAPQRIIYEFDGQTEEVFDDTMTLIQDFQYTRYTPLLYLKQQISGQQQQGQRNVGGFMKGILVKRLESSFHAFRATVDRFIASYERFISMFEGGTVLIGKDIDVYELLESDDEVRLLELQDKGKVSKYSSDDFQDDYLPKLKQDLELLRDIRQRWQPIHTDPKLEAFVQELKTNPHLNGQRLIVFTESKETGEYLFGSLRRMYGPEVMFYASDGGRYEEHIHSVPVARHMIGQNFDPKQVGKEAPVRLLITTDVLAEGMNLHLANVVVNYDLPWNPTRVLQRVGRINRVGTKHQNVYVFNFFPTARSDAELGLEARVKAKLQSFHDTLGEDAKYLSDDEEISSHNFGEQVWKKLNSKGSLEEEEERSELEYLQLLRHIRDHDAPLFERIKRLPRKARSARHHPQQALLTFFRQGKLKKVLASTPGTYGTQEVNFFEAVDLLACPPDFPRARMPGDYFELLRRNKEKFEILTTPEETLKAKGASYDRYLANVLRSNEMRLAKVFTEDDETFLRLVRQALDTGTIPHKTLQKLKKDVDTCGGNPLKILAAFRKHVSPTHLPQPSDEQRQRHHQRREVILSAYLAGEQL